MTSKIEVVIFPFLFQISVCGVIVEFLKLHLLEVGVADGDVEGLGFGVLLPVVVDLEIVLPIIVPEEVLLVLSSLELDAGQAAAADESQDEQRQESEEHGSPLCHLQESLIGILGFSASKVSVLRENLLFCFVEVIVLHFSEID